MKYKLGELTVKNWNDWDRVARDPVTIGAFILQGAGTYATQYIVGYLVTTAITSWAVAALAPKPDFSSFGSQGTLVNSRDSAAAVEFVYGEVRKGGVVTFYESTGEKNKFLHQVIVLAGHEVEAVDDIYINDQIADWNESTGLVSTAGAGDDQTDWSGSIRIRKHLGDQTTADSELVSETSVDANFVGSEIAYLYVRYEYNQDVFANGVPLITAKVRGKKVYDPRTAATIYSNNSALCIRDYIASVYGLNDNAIDEVFMAAAANEADEVVALDAGGTEPRYTTNGIVSASKSTGSVLGDMVTSCAGTLFWGSGYWKLKVGVYTAPVKTLTLDDLRGPINLETRISMRDNFNAVRGTFNDASQGYITADYPETISAAFKAEDGGEEVVLDLPLAYTTSAATAQRLAKLTLFRGREQMTMNADFGLEAFSVEVGDIIEFENERYWSGGKEFEVVGWRFAADQQAGDLRVNLTLRETSQAAFDWNAEETAIISNNTTLPTFASVVAPTNLTLTATASVNNDGITIPAIKATWDISPNAFVQYYEIQYKRLGGEEDYGSISAAQDDSDDWGSIAVTATSEEDYGLTNEPILSPDAEFASVLGSSNSFTIEPVLNGYDYQIRVRAVSALGVRSPFITAALASQGDTTPPNEPLSLTAVGGSKYISVGWTNPADQDLSYVEVWENQTDNLNTATLVGTSSSSNFMRPNLANNTKRYYWARAVDFSLNKSAFTSSTNATTLLIAPNDFDDAVYDLFNEAGAFGIEPVSSLPTTGGFDGQLVLLLPDITIYRWDEATSSWSTDIFTASSVETGSVTYTSFATGIEPVGVVSALPTVAGYEGPSVLVLTTDGKLYRLVSGAWTAAVNTGDITGTIGENLFSDDMRPIERVSALPSTGLFQGRVVLLTSDSKLYRYTGNAWTAAVPAADLTGQVSGTQIADAAITETKIGSNAITTGKIAANAITATEIAANAITANKISTGSISADKIAANAITANKISTGSISADKIAANAITANKIATDAVTADKVAANAITAGSIAADAVTAGTVAAGAINTDQLAANAITSAKIFTGAITADKVAADAITANKIAASSVITSKLAAGAVTAAKISVSELSAISADLGTIQVDTANILDGAITSAKIGTAAITSAKIDSAAITSAKIGDLQVGTLQIADQAVSNTGADSGFVAIGTAYTTVANFSLNTNGGQAIVNANGRFYFGSAGQAVSHDGLWRIIQGSTVVEIGSVDGRSDISIDFSALDLATAPTGNTNYELQAAKSGGGFSSQSVIASATLVVTEIKK